MSHYKTSVSNKVDGPHYSAICTVLNQYECIIKALAKMAVSLVRLVRHRGCMRHFRREMLSLVLCVLWRSQGSWRF